MNRPLRCVIVDDEPIARHGLRSYVDKTDWLECTAMPDSAAALDAYLTDTRGTPREPDIIFIDIEMPGLSGLDYLRTHRVDAAVIIVTAYEQYALTGYELNVTDYLLKPVSPARFLKAAEKARRFISMQRGETPAEYLHVRAGHRMHRIAIDDIHYLESMENYVIIHLSDRKLVTRSTLRSLTGSLPHGRFIQVHKSYVINTARIDSMQGNILNMSCGESVTVSRAMRPTIAGLMHQNHTDNTGF